MHYFHHTIRALGKLNNYVGARFSRADITEVQAKFIDVRP